MTRALLLLLLLLPLPVAAASVAPGTVDPLVVPPNRPAMHSGQFERVAGPFDGWNGETVRFDLPWASVKETLTVQPLPTPPATKGSPPRIVWWIEAAGIQDRRVGPAGADAREAPAAMPGRPDNTLPAIPLPPAVWLMGAALLALAGWTRRRRG